MAPRPKFLRFSQITKSNQKKSHNIFMNFLASLININSIHSVTCFMNLILNKWNINIATFHLPYTGYSYWDRRNVSPVKPKHDNWLFVWLRNFLHKLFCWFISWINWVNSGKFMDNYCTCYFMAYMKKFTSILY